MCALVVSERESGVDELKRAALGVLGYGRMTEKITQCLQQGLELAVRNGRLESVAGKIRPLGVVEGRFAWALQ